VTALSFAAQVPRLDPCDVLQRRLAYFNRARWSPAQPSEDWTQALQEQHQLTLLEGRFLETERLRVRERAAAVPEHPDDFLQWFESLLDEGPGQHDALFPWLAQQASLQDLRWFLTQEIAGEAGFEDLVALAQVRMPAQVKLEMARNYWDEMGRGRAIRMHGPMLHATAQALGLHNEIDATVWESLALANLMAGLAANRRYAYHAIGALGAVELTAPSRVSLVDKGLRRLGVAPRARAYFSLHARIDVVHAEGWNDQVIRPLVTEDPSLRHAIAEGALMRLEAGKRCFERYRKHLMRGDRTAPAKRISRRQEVPMVASALS
jgi:hypothetical protein